MAERRRPGRRPHGGQRLDAALRREARAERPEFSVQLHERVLAEAAARRVAREPAARAAGRKAWLGGATAAAVGVAIALGVVASRSAPRAVVRDAAVAATGTGAGIERLPTPGEIGAGVLAEVTTMAAAAVGMPEWTALAALDPAVVAGVDDPGR